MPVKYLTVTRDKVLRGLAKTHALKASYQISERISQRLLRETHDSRLQVETLLSLAFVERDKGNLKKALDYNDKALDIARKTKDIALIGRVCNSAGEIYIQQKKLKEALQFLTRAKELYEKIGNKKGLTDVYNALGVIFRRQGKLEEAIKYFERVIEIMKEIGNLAEISTVYTNIAAVKQQQGKLDEAIEILTRFGIPIARTKGRKAVSTFNLGDVYKDKGDFRKALGFMLQGRTTFEEIGHGYLKPVNEEVQKLNRQEILEGIKLSLEEQKVAQKRIIEMKTLQETVSELKLNIEQVKELEEQIIQKLIE